MNGVVTVLDSIPESSIAITVYLGGALIALLCWYGLMKRVPKPFGAIGWLLVFAILLTPTVSAGTTGYFWFDFWCVDERSAISLVKFISDYVCGWYWLGDWLFLVTICCYKAYTGCKKENFTALNKKIRLCHVC